MDHTCSVHCEDKDTHVTMSSCMTTDHDEPSIQILQGQPPTWQLQKPQISKLPYTYIPLIPRFGSQLSCSLCQCYQSGNAAGNSNLEQSNISDGVAEKLDSGRFYNYSSRIEKMSPETHVSTDSRTDTIQNIPIPKLIIERCRLRHAHRGQGFQAQRRITLERDGQS